MSGCVNKAVVVGNLGDDPDVRRTQDGRPVVTMSVATNETWRDKATGERRQHTDWHRVVIFSEGLCKVAEQYLKKGSKVYLEGAMKTRKWTDKEGVERYTTEVVLSGFHSQLTLLDRADRAPAPDEASYGAGDTRRAAEPSASAPPAGKPADDMNDEIPF